MKRFRVMAAALYAFSSIESAVTNINRLTNYFSYIIVIN